MVTPDSVQNTPVLVIVVGAGVVASALDDALNAERLGQIRRWSALPQDVIGFARHAAGVGVEPVMLNAVHRRGELARDDE